MATRVQQLLYGLGLAKQADIATISASFLRFRKLNMDLAALDYQTETDEDEVGKGVEFAEQVFPVANDMRTRVEKFGSAEWLTYVLAYGLGGVAYAGGIYTITPLNPSTSLELPYTSLVQQLAEGGGQAIDEAHVGIAVDGFEIQFNYGPGRQSLRVNADLISSGRITTPSGVTLPATQSEHYMLSQSMAISINGTDYVSNKTILSGTFGWRNNLLANAGYFPGSGLQNGAAIRGRLEIGKRVPSFTFQARLTKTSPEYAALIAQTTGTAVITFTYDGTHTVTLTWEQVSYKARQLGNADGLATVEVTVQPQYNNSTGILSASCQCGIVGIAQ